MDFFCTENGNFIFDTIKDISDQLEIQIRRYFWMPSKSDKNGNLICNSKWLLCRK